MQTDDLLLLPLRQALAALASAAATLTVDVIAPPYPSAGVGTLRLVRVTELPGSVALTAAYEGYRRL